MMLKNVSLVLARSFVAACRSSSPRGAAFTTVYGPSYLRLNQYFTNSGEVNSCIYTYSAGCELDI